MKLASFLNASMVQINCKADTKEKLVEELLAPIYSNYRFELGKNGLFEKIMQREAVSSTIFDNGLFVPHTRIEGFSDFLISIGIPEKNNPLGVKMATLILTSTTASGMYLNVLASFSKMAKDEAFFRKILESRNPHEFIEHVNKTGFVVKKNLVAEDIMSSSVISIRENAVMKELTDLMFENKTSYIPVIDEEGVLIGEVTVLDVIRAGIPNYAQMLSNLKFLNTLEPFEDFLKKENALSVSSVMTKPALILSPEMSVVEVAFEFSRSSRRQLPVVKGGKLVGIVSYMDILNKILRS